ncbi:protein binding protein, putative [Ricinus communis]|uniref:RING-type E3 ubiquitin transferase n=1 Tax=Ricinus communis TaxID=3988 RepID=B9REB1_RICCO|nr:protein binding protein, putative [Ricinus communis]
MGNLFCCFHPEDPEDNHDPSSSQRVACSIRLDCLVHTLFTKYAAVFDKGDAPIVPEAINTQSDTTTAATTTVPPQNMSFDVNPNHSHLQQDELTLPGANAAEARQTQHKDVEEQLRGGNGTVTDNTSSGVTSNEYDSSTYPIRHSKEKMEPHLLNFYASLDDEDVCPTCLEEYTFDNPRIVTECKHHYHLGCIYEWQERSEHCPVCDKLNGTAVVKQLGHGVQ